MSRHRTEPVAKAPARPVRKEAAPPLGKRVRSYGEGARLWFAPVRRRVLPVLASVAPLGWTVLFLAVGAWIISVRLGWHEFALIATAGLVLFLLCALLTIGRMRLKVQVELVPRRVIAGQSAAGHVQVTNTARGRLLALGLELPIGVSAARFNLPSLARGATHEEIFVVPTKRRGVIPIGPATTVRGDPLGLIRRTVVWTKQIELFVHPRMVAIEALGAGLLRDLEGQTTNDVSMSDLAFHTLREYSPGDDRRYIHWRSSAKASAGALDGTFLVKQFLDTRRSHLTVVVDSVAMAYREADDFETAISAAASVLVRAIRDDVETTVVAGGQAVDAGSVQATLDALARVDFGVVGLSVQAAHAARLAPDTSIAMLITGANPSFTDLRRAATHFAPEVRVIAVVVDPQSPTAMRRLQGLTFVTLPRLEDLGALLRGGDL